MRDYLALSRTRTYSLTFALPLFVLYELLAALTDRAEPVAVRNAADVMLRQTFLLLGPRGGLLFAAVLVGAAAVSIHRERRRRRVPVRRQVFALMMAESVMLALVFGAAVSTLTALVLSPLALAAGAGQSALSQGQLLVLSLGAGLYEELLFRVLLVSALVIALRSRWPERRAASAAAAVAISALLFSAFHYVGPLGDEWRLASFVFRFLGGLTFSVIYVTRGFGIVAWTHALYDVFLLTVLAAGR